MEGIEERTTLITGSTDGLGRQVARDLAERGATVLVHGRDGGRAEAAAREISEQTGSDEPSRHLADLSSLAEVRELAGEVLRGHDRLDVSVNNAGVILPERRETQGGVEMASAVNHLSHFPLSRPLPPLLRGSVPARVVNVASAGQSPIGFSDPTLKRGYDPMRAYARSKLAMVSHALDLAKELADAGVTANAPCTRRPSWTPRRSGRPSAARRAPWRRARRRRRTSPPPPSREGRPRLCIRDA